MSNHLRVRSASSHERSIRGPLRQRIVGWSRLKARLTGTAFREATFTFPMRRVDLVSEPPPRHSRPAFRVPLCVLRGASASSPHQRCPLEGEQSPCVPFEPQEQCAMTASPPSLQTPSPPSPSVSGGPHHPEHDQQDDGPTNGTGIIRATPASGACHLMPWKRQGTDQGLDRGPHPKSEATFMKKLLCAVVLMTGTGVLADDAMKTAGNDINKAAGATKQAVKKAAIEIADASKKAARDVSTATKKAASKTADAVKKAESGTAPPPK